MQGLEVWRKKRAHHILVDAIRLTEDNAEAVAAWCGGQLVEEIDPEHPDEMQPGINVPGSMGNTRASLGMYVVKYSNQFFTQHNRPFETHYEPVSRPAPPLESIGDSKKARGFADPFGGSGSVSS